jgi:phosphopentomutase
MLIYNGKLLGTKVLEPSGNFTRHTYFLNLLTEEGETFQVAADERAYDLAQSLPQLAGVSAQLRLRQLYTDKGRAFKLTVVELEEAPDA